MKSTNESLARPIRVYLKLPISKYYYEVKGLTGLEEKEFFSDITTIHELKERQNEQSKIITQLLKENKERRYRTEQLQLQYNKLNLDAVKLLGEKRELEKTLKSRNKYIDELECRGSYVNYGNLLARYNRLQEMYKELMEKNIKLHKIIDALMEK